MAEVILKNICKNFNKHEAVKNFDLTIADGEFLSLVGPSGCGKTTILRMIAGLEDIDQGELYIDGKPYNHLPAKDRGIAMVFQSYALFPHMTVAENLAFGLRVKKISRLETMDRLDWAVQLIGLDGLEKRFPRELSGGQRQRVALGRALVLDPKVLLLDEPLSNLDAELRDRMTAELKRLHRQIGKTIIYVTHNQLEAMTLSNRMAVLREGKMIQCDTPTTMYNFPKSEFVARFIGTPTINFFKVQVVFENNEIVLVKDNVILKIDQTVGEKLRPFLGGFIKIGIRPQHIYHHLEKVGKRHSDTHVTVFVDIIEALGDKNLCIAKFGEETITFLVDPDIQLKTDQKMKVVIDGRKFHFMDMETKERLF
jgi:multiple sugar transport system ATP-binding protein